MKILVVSDTHGKNKKIIEKIEQIGKPDLIFHLGDYVGDGLILSERLGISSIIVLGNGDHPSSGFKEEELIEIKGKKIFLTHGHRLGVNYNFNKILYRSKELGADITLFGHTHVPIVENIDGFIIMNPGSPSFPRGNFSKNTFGIIEIDKKIKTEIIELK